MHNKFHDDPEPLNLALASAGLVLGVTLVMYVDIKGRAIQRERAMANNGSRAWAGPGIPDERRGLLQSQSQSQVSNRPNGGYGTTTSTSAGNDDPERHAGADSGGSLLPRSSRQTLRGLSTVQETREV